MQPRRRMLRGVEPVTQPLALLAAVAWLGWVHWQSDAGPLTRFLGWTTLGAWLHHTVIMIMHECAHARVSVSPHVNELFGHALNLVLGVPWYMPFAVAHRAHHQFLNHPILDPQRLVWHPDERSRLGFLVGWPGQWAVRAWSSLRTPHLWPWSASALVTIVSQVILVYAVGGASCIGQWWATYCALCPLHPCGAHWWLSHWRISPQQVDSPTYSHYGGSLPWLWYTGFQSEHYADPQVPWTRLPVWSSTLERDGPTPTTLGFWASLSTFLGATENWPSRLSATRLSTSIHGTTARPAT